jgi:hypothetical protein
MNLLHEVFLGKMFYNLISALRKLEVMLDDMDQNKCCLEVLLYVAKTKFSEISLLDSILKHIDGRADTTSLTSINFK